MRCALHLTRETEKTMSRQFLTDLARVARLAVALLVLAATSAAAQGDPIELDHFAARDRMATIRVDPGSFFEVRIVHTCSEKFAYSYRGVTVTKEPDPEDAAKRAISQPKYDCLATGSETLRIPHESKYAGYFVELESQSKKGVLAFLPNAQTLADLQDSATVEKTRKDLEDDSVEQLATKGVLKELPARLVVIVAVEAKSVDFAFAGGFSVSELTDKRYAVAKRTVAGEELSFAVRDRDAEDDYKLGLTAMIHGRHVRWWPWFAVSFGLGVGSSSEVNYFVGPSLRLGGQGFLTLGYQFGPAKRLPNGVRETDLSTPDPDLALSDPNVLNDLPTKTEGAFFISFSYTFLGSGLDAFKKPFAPAKDAKAN